MLAELQFTNRFYKESRSHEREFTAALKLIGPKIIEILENGPRFDKKKVIPLSKTVKKNIWRIRVNIQPAPYRLFFEWVSTTGKPILRLISFVPKKSRICDPKHSSELDSLSYPLTVLEKRRLLEDEIYGRDIPTKPPKETYPNEDKIDYETPISRGLEANEIEEISENIELLVEPVNSEDFIEIYATKELVHEFARLQNWSSEIISILEKFETTDEACDFIGAFDEKAEIAFVEFLTDSSSPNDLERLYNVSRDGLESFTKRPLSSFLLYVDPEQQEAIDRPIRDNRPFMVRGSAGSGKSIVCLYRLRRLIVERTQESLFDVGQKPTYLFVSYTNALVNSSRSLFEEITMDLDLSDVEIKFTTLDAEIARIISLLREKGHLIPLFSTDLISTAYWQSLKSRETPPSSKDLLEEMGVDFFINEVTEILIDKNVTELDQYLEKDQLKKELRKGVIIPLTQKYRTAIWHGYQLLLAIIEEHKKVPWPLLRRILLDTLEKHPEELKPYHAVIADEVQDFGEIELKLLVKLCKSPGGLMLASDIGQTIFRRHTSISSIDDSLKFNRHNSVILSKSYRMTKEIHHALYPLRAEMGRTHNSKLKETTPVFSGNKPHWIKAPINQHQEIIVAKIKQMMALRSFNLSQFAVLFMTNHDAENFHAHCNASSLPATLHTAAKRIDPAISSIHILTIHSSKGMEFPHVFIPYADRVVRRTNKESSTRSKRFDLAEIHDSSNKLLYVACSRAAESLTIIQESSSTDSPLNFLKPEDWDIEIISNDNINN